MSEHRYRSSELVRDYARAGIGLVLTVGPLLTTSSGPLVTGILVLLAALFSVYGLRTWRRQRLRIIVDDERISADGPFGTSLAWRDLAALKLHYYSTKRDGRGGWMQLSLKAAGRNLRVDSTLEGFDDVVARAAEVTHGRGIELSPTTVDNLRSLGLARDGDRKGAGSRSGASAP